MKKFTKIIAAATAVLLTLGAAGCTKNSYPDFINPTEQVGPIESSEKYVINVQSEGGMQLSGVKVSAMRNGQVIRRGVSINGKIELGIALGEYDLVVDADSLPAGYHLDGTTYKTSGTSREEVTIKIPSALIPANSSTEVTYALGTIMKDFTFTDCYGVRYVLSDLLKSKKAVALNFWYSGCGPCRAEFPHVQRAYASRNDVEFLAICSTHQGDTNSRVEEYKTENFLTFPMGIDTIGLNNAFGVSNFPTTVIIDRYGLIAHKSAGTEPTTSYWTGLFNDFCSDDYSQKLTLGDIDDPTNPGDPNEPIKVKPTYTMPASAELAMQANGTRINAAYRADEDEFSWPWLAGDGYIYSSNTGVGNSYSIVYADIAMKKDEVLSIEYNVSSEEGCDLLHVMIDGDPVNGDGWSATGGWLSADLYVADRDKTIELAFAFIKDEADPDEGVGDDVARIRNIHLSDVSALKEPMDVMRAAASGEVDEFKYDDYVNVVYNSKDGFYHVDTADGALLYITLNQLTPWSDLHTGSTTQSGGDTYYNTLYYMTYYRYAAKGDNFSVTLGGVNLTDTIVDFWSISGYMDGPNYLIPVTEELRVWAEKFVERFARDSGTGTHKDEWLEFCFYYDHYGSADNTHKDGEKCAKVSDPTRGLTINNCYYAYEKSDPALAQSETYNDKTGRNKALINFPLQLQENGTYYEFTAKNDGVYQIQSFTRNCSSVGAAPGLSVYDKNGRALGYANEVRDFDQFEKGVFTGDDKYDTDLPDNAYQGFNHYMTLTAGQTVYLKLTDSPATTGNYDFEISYLGASYDVMLIGSTGGGMWGGDSGTDYIGVNAVAGDDGYYYVDGDVTKPLYIDFVHGSYLQSELTQYNFKAFEKIIRDGIFNNSAVFGHFASSMQKDLEIYLGKATAKDESDPYYGMVKADKDIVELINTYIDHYIYGGRGEGNGWLMFACYVEHYGV